MTSKNIHQILNALNAVRPEEESSFEVSFIDRETGKRVRLETAGDEIFFYLERQFFFLNKDYSFNDNIFQENFVIIKHF